MNTTSNTLYPVPVVRLIILDDKDRVLILKRAKGEYATGLWNLPGGKVDYGEIIEEAIAKELQEETALVCTSSQFLFFQDSLPKTDGEMHCINLYFECTAKGAITLNGESSEYIWIGPNDMNKYDIAFRHDEALMKYWKERHS